MPASPTIERVLRGQLCTGCGLCAGVSEGAVTMTSVTPGYNRPDSAGPIPRDSERRIAQACPGSVVAAWPPAPHRHPAWGPYHRCLTGHANEPKVRHQASSGGMISMLLIHALETGLVDRVLHVEADPERPTGNRMRWSRNREEVMRGAGSRYAASSPLADIEALLGEGGQWAFVGKPCDVSALRRLALVDERVDRHVPLMLSFFCAGLPSQAGADRIVRLLGFEPHEISEFSYRGDGWPGLTRATTHDGRVGEMRYADSWGGQLSKEVQFRCKICPDAVGGVADVACADAWHGDDDGYPLFEEEAGRSLVLTRTAAGEALLASAIAAGAVTVADLAVEEIDRMQPGQARRKRLVAARLAACRAAFQPIPSMGGLAVGRAAHSAGFGEMLKNFLGTFRRIVRGRR